MNIFYILLVISAVILAVLTFLQAREKVRSGRPLVFLKFENTRLQKWARVAFLCCSILLIVAAFFMPESFMGKSPLFADLAVLAIGAVLYVVALYFLYWIGYFILWALVLCWAWAWRGNTKHKADND